MTSIFITPGISGKKPVIEQPGVETFQRFFPQDPGKFCTLFSIRNPLYKNSLSNNHRQNQAIHEYAKTVFRKRT
jgi:hypothetical protein